MQPECLIYGSIVSVIVSFLKRVPFIKKNPKTVAFLINVIVGTMAATHGSPVGIDYQTIITCVLSQFAASVATHEVVVDPIKKNVFVPGDDFPGQD